MKKDKNQDMKHQQTHTQQFNNKGTNTTQNQKTQQTHGQGQVQGQKMQGQNQKMQGQGHTQQSTQHTHNQPKGGMKGR